VTNDSPDNIAMRISHTSVRFLLKYFETNRITPFGI